MYQMAWAQIRQLFPINCLSMAEQKKGTNPPRVGWPTKKKKKNPQTDSILPIYKIASNLRGRDDKPCTNFIEGKSVDVLCVSDSGRGGGFFIFYFLIAFMLFDMLIPIRLREVHWVFVGEFFCQVIFGLRAAS